MPKKKSGQRKNNRTVATTTTTGSAALVKRQETEEEIANREEKMRQKMQNIAAMQEKQKSSKAVRLACGDVYEHKFRKQYAVEEQTVIRGNFLQHIGSSKQTLHLIVNKFGSIQSTLITTYTEIVNDKFMVETHENIRLIWDHVQKLHDLIQLYEVSPTDAKAMVIVHSIRHISRKLKTNFTFFNSSDLPGDVFDKYKENLTTKSKNSDSLVENFKINEATWVKDKESFSSICKMFESMAGNEILRTIIRMIHAIVPERDVILWKASIEDRNTKNEEQRRKNKESKAKTIAFKRERANNQRALTNGDPELVLDPIGTRSELSTQDLLTQMRSMRLSM